MNITKKEADTQIQKWLPVGRGRGTIGVGKWEIQTPGYKIGSSMYFTTWGIQLIMCNNYKLKITIKIA